MGCGFREISLAEGRDVRLSLRDLKTVLVAGLAQRPHIQSGGVAAGVLHVIVIGFEIGELLVLQRMRIRIVYTAYVRGCGVSHGRQVLGDYHFATQAHVQCRTALVVVNLTEGHHADVDTSHER